MLGFRSLIPYIFSYFLGDNNDSLNTCANVSCGNIEACVAYLYVLLRTIVTVTIGFYLFFIIYY